VISHSSIIAKLRHQGHSYLMVFWLLIALLPKLLLPAGFMPGDATRGNWVVICSAGFSKLAQVDVHGSLIQHQQHQSSASHCPFAAAALDTPVSPTFPVVTSAVALPIAIAFIGRSIPLHGPDRAQRSRAPPPFS